MTIQESYPIGGAFQAWQATCTRHGPLPWSFFSGGNISFKTCPNNPWEADAISSGLGCVSFWVGGPRLWIGWSRRSSKTPSSQHWESYLPNLPVFPPPKALQGSVKTMLLWPHLNYCRFHKGGMLLAPDGNFRVLTSFWLIGCCGKSKKHCDFLLLDLFLRALWKKKIRT